MAGPLVEAFARVAAREGRRVAVHGASEGLTRTFADLQRDVADLRRAFDALHLPPRATIVSHVGNRTGFIPLFVASLAHGCAILSVDGDAPQADVLGMAATYGADLIVVAAPGGLVDGAPRVALPCGLAAVARSGRSSWRRDDDPDALVLKVTSGSTHASKVIIATEDNVFADGEHLVDVMRTRSSDVSLAAVPIAHAYGMGCVLLPLLLSGAPVVLRERFVPAQWADDIATFSVTTFPGVPFIFDYLRRIGDTASPVRDIRLLVSAGAPIDRQTITYFVDRFGTKIHSLYGTTETGSITFDPSDTVDDVVSVGWPLSGTTVTLTEEPGFGSGQGRITVQGAAVARRYAYEDPEGDRTSEFTPDGFRTADVGSIGADGRLTLVGRVSHAVNVAGRKVHPREVEQMIAEMPGVVHASVWGIADGSRGQQLVACVQRQHDGVSVSAVRRHCAAALAPFKVPRRIVFTDELPVSGRGKVAREVVETLLAAADARRDDV
jgi:acyl-coenzyme A synthetase/AMP-(fatty) acid ligase